MGEKSATRKPRISWIITLILILLVLIATYLISGYGISHEIDFRVSEDDIIVDIVELGDHIGVQGELISNSGMIAKEFSCDFKLLDAGTVRITPEDITNNLENYQVKYIKVIWYRFSKDEQSFVVVAMSVTIIVLFAITSQQLYSQIKKLKTK